MVAKRKVYPVRHAREIPVPPGYWSVQDAAKALRLVESTVRTHILRGHIQVERLYCESGDYRLVIANREVERLRPVLIKPRAKPGRVGSLPRTREHINGLLLAIAEYAPPASRVFTPEQLEERIAFLQTVIEAGLPVVPIPPDPPEEPDDDTDEWERDDDEGDED